MPGNATQAGKISNHVGRIQTQTKCNIHNATRKHSATLHGKLLYTTIQQQQSKSLQHCLVSRTPIQIKPSKETFPLLKTKKQTYTCDGISLTIIMQRTSRMAKKSHTNQSHVVQVTKNQNNILATVQVSNNYQRNKPS